MIREVGAGLAQTENSGGYRIPGPRRSSAFAWATGVTGVRDPVLSRSAERDAGPGASPVADRFELPDGTEHASLRGHRTSRAEEGPGPVFEVAPGAPEPDRRKPGARSGEPAPTAEAASRLAEASLRRLVRDVSVEH